MRRSLALLALSALSACTNEIDQSTRPQNIVGSYQLLSYGGKALPATIRADSIIVVAQAGTLILNADHTWSETVDFTTTTRSGTSGGPVVAAGSYTQVRELAYLAFRDTVNNYQFSGTAAGGDVILDTVGGQQIVYRR